MAIIHSLKCIVQFSFVVPLAVTRCHLLSFVVTCCHSLPLVVISCTTRCHSLSLVVPLVVNRCHSLPLVVTRCTAQCLSFYKRSNYNTNRNNIKENPLLNHSHKKRIIIVLVFPFLITMVICTTRRWLIVENPKIFRSYVKHF